MKKTYPSFMLIALLTFFIFGRADAQVAVTGSVSVNGNYATLSAAFTAINGVAQTGANILLTINASITEPVTGAVLNNGAWTSLRITPSGVSRIISANVNAGLPLIDLNGADNVHIDGVNIGNNLTFSNTSTSSAPGTSTIRFQTDAVNNRISYCKLFGSATMGAATDGGTIWFGRNSSSTGNDNNVIENCDIGSAAPSSNLPSKCIYSSGTTTTATLNNSNDTIRNCNIYNYFSGTVTSAGVYMGPGATSSVIKDNKFYMEASQLGMGSVQHSAIWISNLFGNNFMVSGNIIGYSSSSLTGTYSLVGSASLSFNVIDIFVDPVVTTNVQNNIIRSLSLGVASGPSPFKGIYVGGGLVSITGNSIGDQTGTGSLSLTDPTPNSEIIMIHAAGSNNITCSNNNIGGVNANLSGTSAYNFYGILGTMTSSATLTCQNNIIGGAAGNSINVLSTNAVTRCIGIYNTNPASNITGNTIRNITSAGGTGTSSAASVIGITVSVSANNHTLSQNLIFNLKNSNVTDATTVTGISFFNGGAGTNLISRNFIHNNSISNNNAVLNGIQVSGGTATYQNNMISLASDTSGAGVNSGASIKGINETGGTNNFYFNSVYVGGSPTSGSNNTFAFSSSVLTNTRNYRNNIFYNARSNSGSTGKHYAVTVAGTAPNPAGLTINNNLYFTSGTGGVFGLFNTLDVADLAAWKTAVGQDAGSYQDNPKFITPAGSTSAANLHLSPSLPTLAEGSGFIIVPITDDYDGQTRSTLTPTDIGADAGNFIYYVDVTNALFGKGKYLTLAAAFAAINSAAQTSSNILITIGANTTEPSTGAVLNNGAWSSISIQPVTTNVKVSGSINAGFPLIDLNGADNVTISGTAFAGFTFSNSSTSGATGTSTIRFQNDATNNKITDCIIEGSSATSIGFEGGVVSFGTTTGVTGNDNNVISNCRIKPAGSNLPVKGISFLGNTTSTALNNSSDTIKNCDIEDYFSPTQWSMGIHIEPGNTDIGIVDNDFFQSATRTQAIGTDHSAIKINNPSGNNFLVSGNNIGSNTLIDGSPVYAIVAVSGTKLYGIYVAAGTTGASNIQNNTIGNISLSGVLTGTGVNSPFVGIYASGGFTNITGNTLGSLSAGGNILLSSTSSSNADMLAVYMTGVSTNQCSNNNIGGISISNSSTGQTVFYCIRANNAGAATATIQNNIIGGTSLNSIDNTTNGAATRTFGIHSDGPTTLITDNIIRNLTSGGGTGTANLASINGIVINNPATGHTISGNEIYGLRNTNVSASCVVNGIYFSSSAGVSIVSENFVHNIIILGSNSTINGIFANAGTTTYKNNMVSIGLDELGSSLVSGGGLNGIREFGGQNNFYFNSIYVGGSPTLGAGNSFAFNSSVTTISRNFRDNVFYNARSNSGSTGKHYSVRVGGTAPNPPGLTLNNNIYLANGSGGVFGTFNGSDVANLAAWKTAVGQDVDSYESNPKYIAPAGSSSAVDLHIDPSLITDVEGNGFDIVGITNDFDGQTRSTLTPVDIGADAGNFLSGNVIVTNALTGNGDYATLADAFNAIDSGVQTGTNINVQIIANTTEPSTGAILGEGAWNSLTISPSGTITVTGAINAGSPLIDLNGADSVTINGAGTLTISNTTVSPDAGTSTIRFRSDATNNTVTNCTILGSSTTQLGVEGGNIVFGGNPKASGNDNNRITFCNITHVNSNYPSKGVHFISDAFTLEGNNSADTVRDCNIYDTYNNTSSFSGVHFSDGSTGCVVMNNKFYQTAPRNFSGVDAYAISIASTTSGQENFSILGNIIGFATSGGTGFYDLTLSTVSKFRAISLQLFPGVPSNVQGNIISNIKISGGPLSGTGTGAPFVGIFIDNGLVNIGNITGNTIGSQSDTASLIYLPSASSSSVEMIGVYFLTLHPITCSNNNIGGMYSLYTGTGSVSIFGITGVTTTSFTCENNVIGGNVANSMQLDLSSSSFSRLSGILFQGGGSFTIRGNTIRNLTTSRGIGTGLSSSVSGIALSVSSGFATISENKIYALKNTNTTTATTVTGIYFGASAVPSLISRNLVHTLITNSNASITYGIHINGGTATYQNNMVRLGLDSSGSSINTGGVTSGIKEAAGTNNIYFNTVYIGGSPTSGSSNTFAFESTVTTNTRNYHNNIFYNARSNSGSTGKHYAVRVGGTTPNPPGLTINNNVYLSSGTGGVFGLFNSVDRINLAAWKTAVGQDAGSFESNPQFINPNGSASLFDLHINSLVATAVESNGFNIPAITDDYDGQTRGSLTPVDIGADAGNFTVLVTNKVLNLSMLVQGFYNSATDKMVRDTVKVYLRNNSTPYAIIDSSKAYLDSLGSGAFTFANASNGTPYYVHLKHRNSIETWSKTAQSFTANSLTYNFSDSISKAFGNNLKQVDTSPLRFAIFGGDVNQNGNVNLTDITLTYNNSVGFVGGYVSTDLNGDNNTNLADILIAFNNSSAFVTKVTP